MIIKTIKLNCMTICASRQWELQTPAKNSVKFRNPTKSGSYKLFHYNIVFSRIRRSESEIRARKMMLNFI